MSERDSTDGFDYGFGAPVYRRVTTAPGDVSNGVGRFGPSRSGRSARGHSNDVRSSDDATSIPPEWDFQAGEKVVHASFGKGVVVNARRTGGDVLLNVAFVEGGLKQLMASMAKLERV